MVIVTGFATDPGAVNAGSNFRLTVHVKNTSSTTAVSNMLFDLQAPAAGTEGAGGSAGISSGVRFQFHLSGQYPGRGDERYYDRYERAGRICCRKPVQYCALTMKYEDGNAVQYEGASSLAIPVQQAARFGFK